jgi:hypothetical protein
LLDEIHRDGIPWLLGNRELLESSIGFMTRSLGASAGGTRLYIVFDEGTDCGPSIIATNEFESSILAEVAGEGMIMMIAKNAEAEVIRLGDVDATIASKISFGILRPPRR